MTIACPTASAPAISGATSLEELLADTPPARSVRRLVVLDNDPTGTQSVSELPCAEELVGRRLAALRRIFRPFSSPFCMIGGCCGRIPTIRRITG
jgi:hypothetical protein